MASNVRDTLSGKSGSGAAAAPAGGWGCDAALLPMAAEWDLAECFLPSKVEMPSRRWYLQAAGSESSLGEWR